MPPTVYLLVVQVTATLVTSAPPMVPVSLVTTHVWLGVVGCVRTVTAYIAPLATAAGKVKLPSALTVRLSPALF